MKKSILLGIAIASAFIIGTLTANPVVDAVGGWKEALGLHEGDSSAHHDIPESQIYEVSDTTVIVAGETLSPDVLLQCLDGDWMFMGAGSRQTTVVIVTTPLLAIEGFGFTPITDPVGMTFGKAVGMEGPAELVAFQAFDVDVTVTILCMSPS